MKWLWASALPSRLGCFATVMGLGIFILGPIPFSHGEVFYSQDEALKIAFPEADSVEVKSFILTDAERSRAEEMARTRVESNLFTFYVGRKNGEILGYAAFESRVVRTLPETLLVVLAPQGTVLYTVVLAFHEPPEYMPADRWLQQFRQKSLSHGLWPGQDIAGIFGSTLTAHAINGGVRKVLTMFQVLVKERR